MSENPAGYANSVAFLLSQLGAHSARLFASRLASLGISPRVFGILSNLAMNDGQTQQQLADALGIHRNNMVGLVDEMETGGWLRRERGVEDRRAFHLRLTPAGRELVERVNAFIPELDDELCESLSPARRRQLTLQLSSLARSLGLSPAVHPHLSSRAR